MVGTTQCGNDRNSQCGKMKNLLSLKIFSSNQLISDSLVKSLLSRDFCQKCVWVNFRNFHSVKFTPTIFWQKLRESNGFTKEIAK